MSGAVRRRPAAGLAAAADVWIETEQVAGRELLNCLREEVEGAKAHLATMKTCKLCPLRVPDAQ